MSDNKKKSNLKTYIIFGIIIVVCFFAGLLAGFLSDVAEEAWATINWAETYKGVMLPTVVFFTLLVVAGFAVSLIIFMRNKKATKKAESLDEDDYSDFLDEMENKFEIPLVVEGAIFLSSLLFFGLVMFFDTKMADAGIEYELSTALVIITLFVFVLSLALYLAINHITVEFVKKINPEKRGNIFELNFRKKWVDSMDEAELAKLGQKTFVAYVAGITTAIFMWLICFIGMVSFDTGILPIIVCVVFSLVLFLTASIGKTGKKKEK